MKPIIALNGGTALDRQFGSLSTVISKTYPAVVANAGGAPLLVTEGMCVEDYAALADGLILTGSVYFCLDLQKEMELLRIEDQERPIFDQALLRAFIAANKPVFGICLGLQCINLVFGGTLEDMFKLRTGVEHMLCTHTCYAGPDSVVGSLFGPEFQINSRHDRKIDRLGDDLIATAWSPDGVIEEIRHKTLPIWATQYHPERMRGDYREPPDGPDMTPLFRWFITQCAQQKERAV